MNADFEFHLLLASMTRNPVTIILFQSLSSVLTRDVLRQRRVMLHNFHESFDIINRNHVAIVKAVEERDGNAAYKAMSAHFSIWNQQFQLSSLLLKHAQGKN